VDLLRLSAFEAVPLPASRRAHAKLNLRLEIGQRTGRLHPLVSVIAPLALADVLHFSQSPKGFEVRCPGFDISEHDNLVWRAASELGSPTPAIRITIEKHIPLQAGLGGGSADAAAALFGISQIAVENGAVVWANTLFEAATRLGSDIPAALVPGLKIVAGTGDIVTPYRCDNPPPWGVLLLKPRVGSGTARAYALLDENNATRDLTDSAFDRARAVCAAFVTTSFHDFIALLHNDFSGIIERAMPEVEAARLRLESAGARRALLCGSGSCVAGFFESSEAARLARKRISLDDGDWCVATTFHV
jgi:4-diphosphocytidyl-2-C-methyl-D-erythritol kinase